MSIFTPPPPAPPLPRSQVKTTYDYWRGRHLSACFIGYAIFYFVRTNMPTALPLLERDLGIGKADLGKVLSLHGIIYGISKFVSGIMADRSNPRYFMAAGLVLSAVTNLVFGLNTSLVVLGSCWILNGWFQGMGFPPCARILSHWFSKKERGRKWAIWNISHQIGGAGISILAGILAVNYGWRAVFIVPAFIAIATSVFIVNRLRDTPESLGLPSIEVYAEEFADDVVEQEAPQPVGAIMETDPGVDPRHPSGDAGPIGAVDTPAQESFFQILVNKVFSNPYVWFICFANFFVYTIRFGFFNWAITYLSQERHYSLAAGGGMNAAFEVAGLFGSVLAGWLADKAMGGRRTPVCLIYLLGTALSILAFWKVPDGHPLLSLISLSLVGFFIYGPQFLVGVMVTDLSSKEAAATAIGLTGFFGYISTVVSGWGLGAVVESCHSWDPVFQIMLWCCLGAAVPFALCWKKS